MIIGIDASRANRKFKSGTEWYSFYLIRALAKIDNKNKYILYSDMPLAGGLANLASSEFSKNQPLIIDSRGRQELRSPYHNFSAKILKWRYSFFWTQLRLSWEMLWHKPDRLFVPAHTLPIIHPKKSIITIHDIGFERERSMYDQDNIGPTKARRRKFLNFIVKFLTGGKYGANSLDYLSWSTRYGLKHAGAIITVSNFSKNEIKEVYNSDGDKIKVIYHGYNNDIYKKIADEKAIGKILNKYGLKKPFIFYVGRLEKKKNIPTLVNAFAIMRERHKSIKHKLILIGNASYGYDEVKYVIQEFNLDDEVKITGWVLEEDMPYIYNAAEAFIFPSNYEGFGIPLLQAMACGTAIAAANIASIPEVAQNACLYFNPNDKNDMADKMAKIILDEKLREELVSNGFKLIKNFSWEKCARETLEVIEK